MTTAFCAVVARACPSKHALYSNHHTFIQMDPLCAPSVMFLDKTLALISAVSSACEPMVNTQCSMRPNLFSLHLPPCLHNHILFQFFSSDGDFFFVLFLSSFCIIPLHWPCSSVRPDLAHLRYILNTRWSIFLQPRIS